MGEAVAKAPPAFLNLERPVLLETMSSSNFLDMQVWEMSGSWALELAGSAGSQVFCIEDEVGLEQYQMWWPCCWAQDMVDSCQIQNPAQVLHHILAAKTLSRCQGDVSCLRCSMQTVNPPNDAWGRLLQKPLQLS